MESDVSLGTRSSPYSKRSAEGRASESGDPRADVTLRPSAVRVHRGQLLTSARDHGDAKRGRACPEEVADKNEYWFGGAPFFYMFLFGKRVSKVNKAKKINKAKHVWERAKSAPRLTQEQPEVVGTPRANTINKANRINVDLVYLVLKKRNKATQG